MGLYVTIFRAIANSNSLTGYSVNFEGEFERDDSEGIQSFFISDRYFAKCPMLG
jgi:hypothetical protein